jgi:N-acetylglucosamine-6-phosphate deacetylase
MNGGGGAQFNEDISFDCLDKMYQVCLKHGTSGFLPSLITSIFEDA